MPDNKDQHFNPQFYLRNFSADENGRSIHLYNIARAKCIFGASIAGQCSRPYFYGKDGRVESGLAMLEDAAAPMSCWNPSTMIVFRTANAIPSLTGSSVYPKGRVRPD